MKIKSGKHVVKRRESHLDLRRHPSAKDVKGKLSPADFKKAIRLAETLVEDYTMCPSCAITVGISSAASATFGQTRSVRLCGHCLLMCDKAMSDAIAKRPPFDKNVNLH